MFIDESKKGGYHMNNPYDFYERYHRDPIFGQDIVDDWSWDREEEEMRESHDDDSSNFEDQD